MPRRYIARLGKGSISVYDLPDMGLLDKKSLKLEGVHEFAWSPSQPILCAYQTEQAGGNLPARISLIGFPDKAELRQKNLFSVSGEPSSHGLVGQGRHDMRSSVFCMLASASPKRSSHT